ncbi:MAG TPA: VOC family protein [Dehalococcoidia bacterium]|nr:VOC family protein [Dehalococcoidia bacterium]
MITRFDHAVIAVRQLELAIERFRRLGFDAHPGGRHSGRGTENAIIRFGLDYIELISVYDEAEARESGWGGSALVDYLAEKDGGLVGFCLATERLDAHVEPLKAALPGTIGPLEMQRRRPDGEVLHWRLLIPSGGPWLSPYPFLIEWQLSDSERLQLETPGRHEVGAEGVSRIKVSAAAAELTSVRQVYSGAFGLSSDSESGGFPLGGVVILLAEGGASGPNELVLRVGDLNTARERLVASGMSIETEGGVLRVDPDEACGAAIVLTA